MPSSPLKSFLRKLDGLEITRKRMEKLHLDNKIVLRDLHSVYEALFIRAVTGFEVFLQDQFRGILSGGATYPTKRKIAVRMTAVSERALEEILMQGRDYLTWLPFEKTSERALIYLKEGKPFSEATVADKGAMTSVTRIRNAIAHQSSHATRIFEEKVIGSLPLLSGERTPAGFLRSQLRAAPPQSRFEFYVGELGRIASALC